MLMITMMMMVIHLVFNVATVIPATPATTKTVDEITSATQTVKVSHLLNSGSRRMYPTLTSSNVEAKTLFIAASVASSPGTSPRFVTRTPSLSRWYSSVARTTRPPRSLKCEQHNTNRIKFRVGTYKLLFNKIRHFDNPSVRACVRARTRGYIYTSSILLTVYF